MWLNCWKVTSFFHFLYSFFFSHFQRSNLISHCCSVAHDRGDVLTMGTRFHLVLLCPQINFRFLNVVLKCVYIQIFFFPWFRPCVWTLWASSVSFRVVLTYGDPQPEPDAAARRIPHNHAPKATTPINSLLFDCRTKWYNRWWCKRNSEDDDGRFVVRILSDTSSGNVFLRGVNWLIY